MKRCLLFSLAIAEIGHSWSPPSGDELYESYMAKRTAFLHDERAKFSGGDLTLSPAEMRVDAWVSEQVQTLIQQYKVDRFDAGDRFAADTYFPLIKDNITKSPLYRALRSMPKGGVLHLHAGSSTSMDWVVKVAVQFPGCHVYWPSDVSATTERATGTIQFFNATDVVPPGYRPVSELRKSDPQFEEKLLHRLTVTAEDVTLTSPQIWEKFQDVFVRVNGLLTHRPTFQAWMEQTFLEWAADGISYMELRVIIMKSVSMTDLDGRAYRGEQIVDVFTTALQAAQKTFPDFQAKILATTLRTLSPEDLGKDLEFAYQVKQLRPDVVIGWDAAGEEDPNHATLDYARQLLNRSLLTQMYGVELPMMLHDGESDWPGNTNVVDALLLGVKRIGHGFNLNDFPAVRQAVKDQDVALEVCPISNQVLRYVDDLREHPGARFLRDGLPVTLSSDDPGIWGAVGVTYDFWAATVAWQLDLKTLKYLAMSSLSHSAMSADERLQAMSKWETSWSAFIDSFAPDPLPPVVV